MSNKETKAVTKPLKEEVLALAAIMEKDLTADKKTGIVTEGECLYTKNYPEGLDEATDKKFNEYKTTFVAAGAVAVGRMAVAAMKSNKELTEASAELKLIGRDKVEYKVDRSVNYTPQFGENAGKEQTKFGNVTTKLTTTSGVNGGQLKLARSHVSELMTAALAK